MYNLKNQQVIQKSYNLNQQTNQKDNIIDIRSLKFNYLLTALVVDFYKLSISEYSNNKRSIKEII